MASTYITRTGVNSEQKIFTISVWVKRNKLGISNTIMGVGSGSYASKIYFDSADNIEFWNYFGGAYAGRKITNRVFRDTSAWYHLVFAVNTTLATASERMRIYVNNEEATYSTSSDPNLNQTFEFNSGSSHEIGRQVSQYFEGCMSHFHFIDGTQYQPTDFGQYDANGVWTIKTSPSVTYGTNGFFILKDGNSVTDQSGNGNNCTVAGGTLTNTEDSPSNVFCTLNPLSCNGPLEDGNTTFAGVSGSTTTAKGTLGVTEGKWYFEAKVSSDYPMIGIGSMNEAIMQNPTGGGYPGGIPNSYGIYGNGAVYANGSNTGNQGFTYTTNDIIGVALDLDSATKTIVWYKNGSQIATYNLTNTGSDYPFTPFAYNGGATATANFNFGNGYFGTTAVASAGTNASGNGIFEYDVPTGYTALSTKGLNL
jgi:hypothetical protein